MKKDLKKHDIYAGREAEKYEHPIPSREFILSHLAEISHPITLQQLIDGLGLDTPDAQEALRRRLIAMERDGQLMKNRRGAYAPLDKMDMITGRVQGHKDGFGFVIPDDGSNDLFISARQMRSVFDGDRVLARVTGMDYRKRREGAIVEVVEHNTTQLVGRFIEESGIAFVTPSNHRITQDVLIPADMKLNAVHGDMVVTAITAQPTARTRAIGKIVEVLGAHMAPGMEIDVSIRNHDLPYVWPDVALKEAAQFAKEVPASALAGRNDLRHLAFVTIDGEDAKDFDDAVYCEALPQGGWLLYVAIADVSAYVMPNTALDKEALVRGNSVYFPGRVIPMLPEVLSNGLCSLNPKLDRLVLVCEMNINPAGIVTRYKFSESVIHSKARLTYNQVYAMLVEKNPNLTMQHAAIMPHLQALYAVYQALHKSRVVRGAIDFDLPETKIVFGPKRKIKQIVPVVRNDAHRLIEECMLCANIAAANFILEHERLCLFRVHEGPSEVKLEDLRRFLTELGLRLPGRRVPTPKDYATLLASISDRPDAHLIQTILLRSLSQAVYTPLNKGHFGLAFEAYTHFTSPIRRYADLITHRVIRSILQREKVHPDSQVILEGFGTHCSRTERRADDATREVVDWLKCEFMLDKLGAELPGVISAVTSFGFFVELSEIYVEGLVHITTLPSDFYHFDAARFALQGERTGKTFRLGDLVTVKVVRVDLDERQIDLILAGMPDEAPRKAKKSKQAQKKKAKKRGKK